MRTAQLHLLLSLLVLLSSVTRAGTTGEATDEALDFAAQGVSRVAVAWNDSSLDDGFVRAMRTEAPWTYTTRALRIGADATLRFRFGRLFAVSTRAGTVTVIDPQRWTVLRRFDLGANSEPLDIALAGPQRGYVTRRGASWLARLDLRDGTLSDVVDLAHYATPDEGIPDLAMMARWHDRLFVQVRRFNIPPALLAVVDLNTETLIDVDPSTPAIDAIELAGRAPRFKMQTSRDRLLLSATGGFFDDGGIESIDPLALQSLGLIVRELDGEVGADLGAFTMLSPDRGFLTYSTDLLLSSHLHRFAVGGSVGPELHVSLSYFVPVLLFDRPRRTIYYPEGDAGEPGVHVFDARDGRRLTETPTPTSGAPTDLELMGW